MQSVLTEWGIESPSHIPVLLLVEPLATLALHGCWSEIVVMGQGWGDDPFDWSWPDANWLKDRHGEHLQRSENQSFLSHIDVIELSSCLKQWAPAICNVDDPDDPNLMRLEGFVKKLDDYSLAMTPMTKVKETALQEQALHSKSSRGFGMELECF